MSGEKQIEQYVVIAGTSALEVAKAISMIVGEVPNSLQKAEHPNSDDYPETYSMWKNKGKDPIFGVSCLYRPRIGSNGADFRHYDPTGEYRIVFYQQEKEINTIAIEEQVEAIQAEKENSFMGRVQRSASNVRWALTNSLVNFP